MSVWDVPGQTWAYPAARNGAAVPVSDPAADRRFGREDGRQYRTPDGLAGVYGGVPLGETELNRQHQQQTMWWLQPSVASRLHGSYRSIFGR
jgi:hypothetical protein